MDIQTPTLILVPQTIADIRGMIETMSPAEKAQLSADWLAQFNAATVADPWVHGFRMIHRGTDSVVGSCSFKGPPVDGMVEIAYGVLPAQQGRGYATEAALGLVAYAFGFAEVRVVRAHTLPEGKASKRVLDKCGFRYVGDFNDPEDGLVCRFERVTRNAC